MNVLQAYRDGVLAEEAVLAALLASPAFGLLAGMRNLGSLQSGPGLIMNQALLQSNCGLLGQRPATKATRHLRISQSSAHLPGGIVQQGCMFGGSLRA